MNKETIVIPCLDTVTIPRAEYNDLIAAKAANDIILSVSDPDGYGCADIVKGLQKHDKYKRALLESEARVATMMKNHDDHVNDLLAEIGDLKAKLKDVLKAEAEKTAPEETANA